MPEVVHGGEGGGEPVAQPPKDPGGVEEVAFQFDRGCRGGGHLAQGPPVDQLPFGDREGHAYVPASCGHRGEEFL